MRGRPKTTGEPQRWRTISTRREHKLAVMFVVPCSNLWTNYLSLQKALYVDTGGYGSAKHGGEGKGEGAQ
jgi:hypothetical protein